MANTKNSKFNLVEVDKSRFNDAIKAYFLWKELDTIIRTSHTRGVNIPETITETLLCYVTGYKLNKGSAGDAYDESENRIIEIKATSNFDRDTTSFSPKEDFDELHFVRLDKREDVLYFYNLDMNSEDLKNIKVNSTETLGEQLAKTDYPCNSYEVIKIKGDTVSFIECEGWDSLREPIVGNAYNVKSNGSVKLTKKREKNPQIYHHKWMFVAEDYDGFDIEKEKEWSKKWQSVVPKGLSSSLGSIDNWKKFLKDYGLEN